MPGSSLWLLPPARTHPLHDVLATLIARTLPARFPHASSSTDPRVAPHFFPPHVTLTSGIAPDRYLLAGEDGRRGEGPQAWLEGVLRGLEEWREEFGPHVSLMYGDVPIGEQTLKEITAVVREAGVNLGGEEGADGKGWDGWDGWDGGVVWLVPTDKPMAEWKPIATVEL
ncbi:hypothetical protein BT67DRAFT_450106 [Trichocladium antarcticum]|uniref:2',3'-cyclic-nucleotide 3'-phosphodiesterase n=1 Tax=Trichocladium antarcticum TaxID=1450529 RepID=A0AAN6UIN2_9PEZI|nr:hypothetical protein BT67DRAFT_450106 [Trichocladium antarcticum]